jgi:hypothetical protein
VTRAPDGALWLATGKTVAKASRTSTGSLVLTQQDGLPAVDYVHSL